MWNTYYCQTIMDYCELWKRKRHRQAMHEVHCAETLHDGKQWCFSHRRSRTLNTAALLHTLTTPCWVFLGPWRERLASCAAHRPSFWPQAACVKLVRIRAKKHWDQATNISLTIQICLTFTTCKNDILIKRVEKQIAGMIKWLQGCCALTGEA